MLVNQQQTWINYTLEVQAEVMATVAMTPSQCSTLVDNEMQVKTKGSIDVAGILWNHFKVIFFMENNHFKVFCCCC